MNSISQGDLELKDYKWSARADHDDPRITHFPDNVLLNRTEGYEVISFINRFLKNVTRGGGGDWTLADVHKIERGIRIHPTDIRSQVKVRDWILANWIRL